VAGSDLERHDDDVSAGGVGRWEGGGGPFIGGPVGTNGIAYKGDAEVL
jgi:hypothetical protein